ncbi:hypothetical protein KUTeg_008617 [Tegillarca granosa]|uniref:Uncharacterized protein n=1 Tax=Tegillarca granosa TaxID=220873 RepID=A0ABQ9FBS7_TEGGR|nr:hypothetical protein KUTeg_008617 [Tegillarca granosa]
MTALSNLLAVGTMPLNLYLYAGHWTNAELKIPYVNIVTSFLMVFVPVIIGMVLNWKWPKKAPIIIKIGSICGMVVIVLITVFIGVQNRRVFFTTWKPFVASIVTPFCAFLIGYICSYISCLGHRKSKTIAIETGIQNFPLCMTVLSLSFPTKLFVVLSVYPLLYGIVSVVDGLTIVIAQKIINAAIKTYKKTSINDEAKEMEVLNQDSSKEKDTNISTPFRFMTFRLTSLLC